MNFKKFGVLIGLSSLLILSGCQSTDSVENSETEVVTNAEEAEEHSDEQLDIDYSKGFETSKIALDAYMQAIIIDDFEKAYESLHEIDKETFTKDDFVAYQTSMQLAKDIHGYDIHDEQTFFEFDFAGTLFERVDFFDLDYAYIENGEEPMDISETDDHGHDEGSDYHTHDHGHEMATMGVATVQRNGIWYVLQGQSAYEIKDLTRKYTNQSVSLSLEEKESYALGESVSVGNMIISVDAVEKDKVNNKMILDVTLMNAGFDPLNTIYFINKFAVIDNDLKNFMSLSSNTEKALSGVARAGSFVKGTVEIPVDEGFDTDSVYFLMNTIDPSKEPVKFDLTKSEKSNTQELYNLMMRKPAESTDSKAYIDGLMINISNVEYVDQTKWQTAPEGWKVMKLDAELSNLTDELLYINQIDMTVRTSDGCAKSIQDQFTTEKLEGVMTVTNAFEVLVKDSTDAIELTLCIRDPRPNNSVTIEITR